MLELERRSASKAEIIRVLVFTLFYLGISALVLLKGKNTEFFIYLALLFVVMGILYICHRRAGLSKGILWAMSAWGLVHMVGGLLPIPEALTNEHSKGVFYNYWFIPGKLKYDQVVHAFGFGATTWLCWQVISSTMRSDDAGLLRRSFGILSLCAAVGMGYGALNELIEFLLTVTLPETNVGGYFNTGWDLVANLVGCIGATLLIKLRVLR